MTDTLIKVEGVSKKFCRDLKRSLWYGVQDLGSELLGRRHGKNGELRADEFWAVNNISFELKRGECLGLIGHNGAGKTTLLRMLNGLIKPDKGRIEMRGRVGALIALGAGFNPVLTGRENIYVNASILGLSKREIETKIDEIIDFADIGDFIDSPVQNYSSGMSVRLGFAVAIISRPDILLLDEVLAVGDIRFQAKCFNALSSLKDRGTCFIIVSHNMHQISRYAQKSIYLNKGSIESVGNVDACIARFQYDSAINTASDSYEQTHWDHVYGTGKVILMHGCFFNSDGKQVEEISAGDSVTLLVDYDIREEISSDPILDVMIRDHEMILYQGTNHADGICFKNLPKIGSFCISFPAIFVNSDWIDFFICLYNKNTLEVYDWKRHLRLKIKDRKAQIGKLNLPVKWSITETIACRNLDEAGVQ